MPTTTLTSKGQNTLPKRVRDQLDLKQGERLRVDVGADGKVVLERERRPSLDAVYGALEHLAPRKPVSPERMRQAVRERARKKHRR